MKAVILTFLLEDLRYALGLGVDRKPIDTEPFLCYNTPKKDLLIKVKP